MKVSNVGVAHALARTLVAPAAVSLMLAGCGVYDAAEPTVLIENRSSEAVVVDIETGTESRHRVDGPGEAVVEVAQECLAAVLTIETESGERWGLLEEDLCPGWRLTITEDGEIEYEPAR